MAHEVRWTRADDDPAVTNELIRDCWRVNYAHLFDRPTIDAIFSTKLPLTGSWLHRRTDRVGGLVAEGQYGDVGGDGIIGIVEVGLLDGPSLGEVMSLYVAPSWQGQGIGTELWNAGLSALRGVGCDHCEVWALEGAKSQEFYVARGGREFAAGWLQAGPTAHPTVGYAVDL